MSKYENVSDEYAEQLHELAKELVTPERFGTPQPKEEIVLIHMTPEQFLGALALARENEQGE